MPGFAAKMLGLAKGFFGSLATVNGHLNDLLVLLGLVKGITEVVKGIYGLVTGPGDEDEDDAVQWDQEVPQSCRYGFFISFFIIFLPFQKFQALCSRKCDRLRLPGMNWGSGRWGIGGVLMFFIAFVTKLNQFSIHQPLFYFSVSQAA
ncbi:hypothetical protein PISL3812_05530 [Talaromyces islandicus]|uniref:Uncharacterized protein n=1 Tax=Talaromyces islandicus TaxID=28573 RepID=A0A0U1LYT6_TALIS|nr:hypothetical protein PISL3812_05530 [Talaromyces islandicus]